MKGLEGLFRNIPRPTGDEAGQSAFAVVPVSDRRTYFVGKDVEGRASLLIATPTCVPRKSRPPIRLGSLDAQFDLRCRVRDVQSWEGRFTILRCRASDQDLTRYFLAICETLLRVLGSKPSQDEVAIAVGRLAEILRRVERPSVRSLIGLFGELFLLSRSSDVVSALSAWRPDDNARFDFSEGAVRLDVKATSSRQRVHTFSYEQCNLQPGVLAVVASLHAETTGSGTSLYSLIRSIEDRVSSRADLIFKLHENIAGTLGTTLDDALQRRYDVQLAETSLRFFRLDEVPAIRGELPIGVSNVHFRSDVSTLRWLTREELIAQNPDLGSLLPSSSW